MGLREQLETFVRSVFEARIDAYGCYAATVVQQRADGTLDLKFEDDRVRRLVANPTQIPIRYGEPGLAVKVKQGTRCMVQFEGGSFSRPIVTMWAGDGLKELVVSASDRIKFLSPEIQLGDGATRGLARVGDLVGLKLGPMFVMCPPTGGPAAVMALPADGIPGITPPSLPAAGVILSKTTRVKTA